MRVVVLLLIPIFLFSAWQYTRREENENRLALVASEVALRDVDVSCPGFWMRLVEITPNAGWVDFDEQGRPSDETSLSASTCSSLEHVWRGKQRSFALPARRRLQPRDARRGQRRRHARARVLAPARDPRRGADAVLRRPDRGEGRARPWHRGRGRSGARGACRRGRRPRARRAVPLDRMSARRPLRPPPGHARLAQQLAALDEHARPPVAGKRRAAPAGDDEHALIHVRQLERGARGRGGPSREISS